MKRHLIIFLGLMLCAAPLFTSCSDSDSDGSSNEFANWRERNEQYFASVHDNALGQISTAKAQYGAEWEEQCDWRAFLSYGRSADASSNTLQDSVFVQILTRGTGSGCPLVSDKVRVYYAGRLMPTDLHPDGKMFDHSGQSTQIDKIFDHKTATPTMFNITDIARGLGTALLYMHIGDKWRVYMPYKLGYNTTEYTNIPSYSTLIFDVELVQYARNGTSLPEWS